ncbi:MAG TPA: acetyl/propionyl-CoA carboxylase subunit alpha, partial [Ottowia sp.]|nr:acetyl/propionyl-CoA carboxylase subunit alpha [Ottowia sp.]
CVLGKEGHNEYVDVSLSEVVRGEPTQVTVHADGGDRVYELALDNYLGDTRIAGRCNGRPFTAQMERGQTRNPLAIRVMHDGTQRDAIVMHPGTAVLHKLMPYKAPPDMSKFVLSPMPGLLVQVAVQPGQKVQAGERVAVIEAMKMENVLLASTDGVVKEVKARQGDSLAVDQAIVEFE